MSAASDAALPSSEAPIDAAKVEKIRAAIADGSFGVDTGAIADGLIASARELAARSEQDKQ